MSKMGQHVIKRNEDPDFQFGWVSALRGEPKPMWEVTEPLTKEQNNRLIQQQIGWQCARNSREGIRLREAGDA